MKIKHIVINPCVLLSIIILVFLLTPISFAKKEQFDKNTKLIVRDADGKQVGLLLELAPSALILLEINGIRVLLKTPDFGELDESGFPLHGTVDSLNFLNIGGTPGDYANSMPTAYIVYESVDCSGEPFVSAIASAFLSVVRLGLYFASIGPPGLDPGADDVSSVFVGNQTIVGNIDVGSKRTWNLEDGSFGECEAESAPGLPVTDYQEVGEIPEFTLPFSIEIE